MVQEQEYVKVEYYTKDEDGITQRTYGEIGVDEIEERDGFDLPVLIADFPK